ncbi:hypothetical protein EI94DRAFT_1698095 [Lactarius quietus]|nr:hypothetical protein EI94DRAFT_1698095 [Lactarius quietus]
MLGPFKTIDSMFHEWGWAHSKQLAACPMSRAGPIGKYWSLHSLTALGPSLGPFITIGNNVGQKATVAGGHACQRAKAAKATRACTANADSEGATKGDTSEEKLEVWLTDEQASMLKKSWRHGVDVDRDVVEMISTDEVQKRPKHTHLLQEMDI